MCKKKKKKTTHKINSKMVKTKNNRVMLLSQCSNCKNKQSSFISEKEVYGIL